MSTSPKTVLCIDDDQSVLTMRRLLLESQGYVALTAESGKQGLKLLQSHPVSAILLDYRMPEMSGAVVAARVKQEHPHLPIILLSAYPDLPDEEIKNVDVYMEKGQSPLALISLLSSLIKIRDHAHPELSGEYFAFMNSDRQYIEVSDGLCQLLGYQRARLIGKTIDEITYPNFTNGGNGFRRREEPMEGQYQLLHRNGNPVDIHCQAFVLTDGCMGAQFKPL